LIVFNAEHLRRILAKYSAYYNEVRVHVSLGKDAPVPAQSSGSERLLRIQSLAVYTIDTLEFSFRKGHLPCLTIPSDIPKSSTIGS